MAGETGPVNISKALVNGLIDTVTTWHNQFVTDRIRQQVSPNFASRIELFLYEIRSIRWGLVSSPDRVAEIWNKVMPGIQLSDSDENDDIDPTDDDIVDYVLNGVTFMLVKSCVPSGHMNQVFDEIISGMSWASTCGVIDSALKDRTATAEFISSIIKDTPWFLFLFLLSIAPIEFTGMIEIAPGNGDT